MLSCSMWFSAPSFWMGGGLESRCVGSEYDADGARHRPYHTHDLRSGSQDHHPSTKTRYRKPYAATQHPMLPMMGVCTRNVSS